MPKMKWTKPSAETIAYFERIAPGPPIEARSMFGMPARFLNGHMLVGVFGDTFMLHLSQADREECIRAGAKPFAPLGREAKAYVDVKPGLFEDRTLKEWIVRGMRYLGSLPPKLKQRDGGRAKRGDAGAKRSAESKRGGAESKRGATAKNGAAGSKRSGAPAKKVTAAKKAGSVAPKRGASMSAKKATAPKPAARKSAAPKKTVGAVQKKTAKRTAARARAKSSS